MSSGARRASAFRLSHSTSLLDKGPTFSVSRLRTVFQHLHNTSNLPMFIQYLGGAFQTLEKNLGLTLALRRVILDVEEKPWIGALIWCRRPKKCASLRGRVQASV